MSTKHSDDLKCLMEATHHDPFQFLGQHRQGKETIIRAFLPQAEKAQIVEGNLPMERVPDSDLFVWKGQHHKVPKYYRIRWWRKESSEEIIQYDPYAFPSMLSDFDLHLFGEGKHWHAYRLLGAHHKQHEGIPGVLFSVWAPNAARISVVGDFNQWDGRANPMRVRGGSGVWELFIPGLGEGTFYKFEIRNRTNGDIFLKTDPYGRYFEKRPNTAAIVVGDQPYAWQDQSWLEARAKADWQHRPMSIYEVHLSSWRHPEDKEFFNYRELAHQLVDYVLEKGFTHIELLPITEHPLDASWGYQTTGYYAPTSRFGSPEDFRYFINHCHQNGIGVLLDWAPAHFPKDAFALARFDGTPLYEHEDPRLGEHRDWNTFIFNYGRHEVKNFLISSALYWLEEFHLDGLRVDAVASMLYLDYSRPLGEWVPNQYGGRENIEALEFLKELNSITQSQQLGSLMIAEESTAWPQVTRPSWVGGLGFSLKWNMGWMNDTLTYISKEPIHRSYHHNWLTFSLLYAFTENFVLPFSHDEVVHGKHSLLDKMPGDAWQRFANLRLLYTYLFTHPGKKLLFMGCEFAQGSEWDAASSLDWDLLNHSQHQGIDRLVTDLNHLYRDSPALHHYDFDGQGFEWVDCHDAHQSVLIYLRKGGDQIMIVALNFTPVPRSGYRVGVPEPGNYRERFNSDSLYYDGSNVGNCSAIESESVAWMGRPHSLVITIPPLGGVVFALDTLADNTIKQK